MKPRSSCATVLEEETAVNTRAALDAAGVLGVHLCGSPGSGKTALLEATARRLAGRARVGVIVAHPAAERDAEQLRHRTAGIVAVETPRVEPDQIHRALERMEIDRIDVLFIETALEEPIDLGERARAALFSVTGGDDKAAAFPQRISGADVVLLSKVDLLPFVKFDPRLFRADVLRANARAELMDLSARDGSGVDEWVRWLTQRLEALRAPQPAIPSMPEWWFG